MVCCDQMCIRDSHRAGNGINNLSVPVKMCIRDRYNEFPGGRGSQHTTDFYWTGIAVKKLVHPESGTGHWARVVKYPYPIIRLSDLYLMYAEAYNEYYGPHQEVYDALNKIRTRGGLKPVEDVWSNGEIVKNVGKHLTKEGLRDIIHKERSIELCFEGKLSLIHILFGNLPVGSARLYFSGQNLFNFSSFKLWDPEMGGEGFNYPLQKVYSIGLNISF